MIDYARLARQAGDITGQAIRRAGGGRTALHVEATWASVYLAILDRGLAAYAASEAVTDRHRAMCDAQDAMSCESDRLLRVGRFA